MPHSLFISDLHLSADHAHSIAAFRRFIATLAPQAEALYILGDLFEYWAGDDDRHDPFHAEVTGALHGLSALGVKVRLMHGNRDLLMGDALAKAAGADLLDDPTLLDLYGTPTLLSHGDTLCTDDVEYQQFRAQVRSPVFRQKFLARPLAERKAYIEQLRRHSDEAKRIKASEIMDVNDDAVAALLRQHRYPRLIHGHTHRPKRHEHVVDGHRCERWVLSDWDQQPTALCCDAQGCRVLSF
ncbi:MAG: UDP-2,3-diacylglucosamine diphosphatase [Nitrosomonadales bacterium]|nr:UDP-2,3-diacylglucosamine diphosphatase [Nitrosomonadales bacterium]